MPEKSFIRRQWTPLPYPTKSFKGQTVIVTGSNTGLGLEAARHFTRLGAAKVIIAVRSLSKGKEAAKDVETSTQRPGVCEVWELDMADYESIKRFVERASKLDRLDVVVENAGVAKLNYEEIDGVESTIRVNVIGTFLLAVALLPILRKSSQETGNVPRLTIVSSDAHGHSPFDERNEPNIFEAMNRNDPKYFKNRYPTSKLLEVLIVRKMGQELQAGPHATQPIVLNNVSPGFCVTGLSREAKGFTWLFFTFMKLFIGRTAEMGSRALLAGASGGDETHGQYMSEGAIAKGSPLVESEEGIKLGEKLYGELLVILNRIWPGVTKNI